MIVTCFVDEKNAGKQKYRRNQTCVLIFINRYPINCYRKRQTKIESSTFALELCEMKESVDMVGSLRYKLRVFSVPIERLANIYCENKVVYNNAAILESTLKMKHHLICYNQCQDSLFAGYIRVGNKFTENNLDYFSQR